MLRKEYCCKNDRYEKKRKEETEQEAEIKRLKREVERGKMEISKLKKLLEQFREAGDKYDEPRRSPSTDSLTLTHAAASTTERFEEDKTGGGDRGTGSTNLPPKKLSREEWNEEIQVRRAKKKTVIIEGLTLVTKEKKEELEGWMWNILQIKARVNKLERIEGGWKAELEEWKAKLKLMKEKTTLGDLGRGVWIKDDLTERQKEVKTWLEKEAEAWRLKGKRAGTGYQSLWVGDIYLQWDELEGELKLKREREERKLFRDSGRGRAGRQ